MPASNIPNIGSRVNVQLFAGDLLAHQGLVTVAGPYESSGYVSAVFSDGGGVKVALSGDRSSVRMVVSAVLAQLGSDPDLDPPAVEEEAA
jgi:hypothetical protein